LVGLIKAGSNICEGSPAMSPSQSLSARGVNSGWAHNGQAVLTCRFGQDATAGAKPESR